MNDKLVGIYLNDHLAGATAGVELAKRTANSNRDNAFGPRLQTISAEIEEDKKALEKIMDDLGVTQDVLKRQVAFVAERIGRFKMNGQLTGYSPLSRLVECEGLKVGIAGKLALWTALQCVDETPALDASELAGLARRAEDQLERIEALRLEAAVLALDAPEDTDSR